MSKLSKIGHALYEGKVSIDFVGRKWLWYSISGLIVALALFGLLGRGLNLGIEFKGGVEYRVVMPSGQANQAAVERIREGQGACVDLVLGAGFGGETEIGLGCWLSGSRGSYGPNPRAFGHDGYGRRSV